MGDVPQNGNLNTPGSSTENGLNPDAIPPPTKDLSKLPSTEPNRNGSPSVVVTDTPSNIQRTPSTEPTQNEPTIPGPFKSVSPKPGIEVSSISNSPAPMPEISMVAPPPPTFRPTTIQPPPNPYTYNVNLAPRSSVLAPPPGLPITAPPLPNSTPAHPPFRLAPPVLDGSAPLPGFYNHPYSHQSQQPFRPPPQATPYSFTPPPIQQTPPIPEPPKAPTPPPQPPSIEYGTVNCIILSNFDETAIKDKNVQTEIIFGRKFLKAPKSKNTHQTLCPITGYPAKYRDPKTSLPYSNSFAYRELQKLIAGEYHWSDLLGAYVGAKDVPARGVPPRFSNPAWKPLEDPALPMERVRMEAREREKAEREKGQEMEGEKGKGPLVELSGRERN